MIFVVELKKRAISANILDTIVGKFRYGKKLCPIIIFETDKNLKIYFHRTILSFIFTIRLRVKDSKKFLLNT